MNEATDLPLVLEELERDEVRGIYGGSLPSRMRLLHPISAESFRTLAVVCSDMFRSADAQLAALRTRQGSKRPGYSGHNFGLSIDLDVRESMALHRFTRKRELDEYMSAHGWLCHRRDHLRYREDWHYNFGVGSYLQPQDKRTAPALDRKIRYMYGRWFDYDSAELQRKLAQLRLYRGEIDGELGPLTDEAVRVFQHGWGLHRDGVAGPKTKRTIAYVTAVRAPRCPHH